MIYRLVGFYEYVNALRNFDKLVATCDQQELEAIDEIINEHDEYAVYTNLSRGVQVASSPLDEKPQSDKDAFERRGLRWIMALARVEVGAMLGTFANIGNPFAMVRPTTFERDEYRELLEDGMRTHYWSLVRDPQLRAVVARSLNQPDQQTLAYVRRLSVARGFLDAAAQAGGSQRPSDQVRELAAWKSQLDQIQSGLQENVQRYLERSQVTLSKTTSSSKTDQVTREIANACGRQLRNEARELESGAARIEVIDFNNRDGSPRN